MRIFFVGSLLVHYRHHQAIIPVLDHGIFPLVVLLEANFLELEIFSPHRDTLQF